MKKLTLSFLLAVVATSQAFSQSSSVESSATVSIERDDFKKVTKYSGQALELDKVDLVIVRAWKYDGKAKLEYQIYVSDDFTDGWRKYRTAYDSDGRAFPLAPIHHDVNCSRHSCRYTETVGFDVDRKYLMSKSKNGVSFKIDGQSGSEVFTIPSYYLKSLLESIPEDEVSKPTSKVKDSAKK